MRILLVIPLLFILYGCSSAAPVTEEPEIPAKEIYEEANAAYERGSYKLAAEKFDELERQHPYSEYATTAQFMSGYAHYNAQDYEDAILAFDRFIELHPGNENVAEAYYIKALSYYEQITDVERDQHITLLAAAALREVYMRFPKTGFANDARMKYDLTQDHLAGKEMAIGRYYLKRYEYVAAMNRFRSVVDNFQTSSHTPEALYRLVEVYVALRLNDDALKTAAVLGHNFPTNKWYKDAYNLLRKKGISTDA